MKKTYIYIILVGVVGIVGIFALMNRKTSDQAVISPSPSSNVSVAPVIIVTGTPKPKGQLNVQIHDNVIVQYDRRRILLASDCQSAEPSNIDFKNGTSIMLDNVDSTQARTIRIGDTAYDVGAGSWIFIKLSSPTLPVNMPMYCGAMQLGYIGIVK